MKWLHFNAFVDGNHHIRTCDSYDEAEASVKEFLGHLGSKVGMASWIGDDGDKCTIEQVNDEDVDSTIREVIAGTYGM